MSIVQAIQTFVNTCPYFSPLKQTLSVNYLEATPVSYGIFPLPGEREIEAYPISGGIYEYPFVLQVNASNADEFARLETQGFFEDFGNWLEAQAAADNFPVLASGLTAFDIYSQGNGHLLDQGDSNVSTYEVPCKLLYERK